MSNKSKHLTFEFFSDKLSLTIKPRRDPILGSFMAVYVFIYSKLYGTKDPSGGKNKNKNKINDYLNMKIHHIKELDSPKH